MLRAIIFDLHGTLLDDEALHARLLLELAAENGIELDASAWAPRIAGLDDRSALRLIQVEGKRLLGGDELRRLLALKSDRYAAALEGGVPLFPGARALVDSAARRFPIGVVATSSRAEALAALKGAGLFRHLAALVTADDREAEGRSYESCLARMNEVVARYRVEAIAPRSVLAFEDSEAGIHAAQRAGCKVAAVAHTQRMNRLAAAETHAARLVDFELEALEKELF